MAEPQSDFTPNLSLPFLLPSQAQKHVTVNESLAGIDALLMGAVLSRDIADPPGDAAEGDAYIVAGTPSGAWDGHDGDVAVWANGGWTFYPPKAGWRFWLADQGAVIVFDGVDWRPVSFSDEKPTAFGINTDADATNRFAVKSDAVLLSNDDVTPGTGDIRVAISKSSMAHTASIIFQDDFSARSEIGLTGDNDLTVRVSPDGANWNDALRIDPATSNVGIGAAPNTTDKLKVEGQLTATGPDGSVENQPNGRIALYRTTGGPVFVRAHSAGSSLHLGATNQSGEMQGNALVINPDAERLETSFSIAPRSTAVVDLGAAGAPFRDLYMTNSPIILSDRRQKHEVETFDAGLEVLQALNPVTYERTDEPGVRRVGLIAQHVRSALKELGYENFAIWRTSDPSDPESPQAVSYGELIPVLIDAVNELAERVEDLEARAR